MDVWSDTERRDEIRMPTRSNLVKVANSLGRALYQAKWLKDD